MLRSLVLVGCLIACGLVFAQQSPSSTGAAAPPTSDLSGYVTIIGGILAGVTSILGFPILRLNQKKTRAEIVKLELEAAALREKSESAARSSEAGTDGIQISVSNSNYTTVQVLADPRLLAPMLLLLD